MTAPSRKIWLNSFRIIVSVVALCFLAWKIGLDRESWQAVRTQFRTAGWGPAVLAVLLVCLNLGLEAEKWRQVVRPIYPALRWVTAFKATLAGMAAGIFTPNRVGDYAGRILYLPEGKRLEAIVPTFADRICQMGVTLLAGVCASLFYLQSRQDPLISEAADRLIIILGPILLLAFILFLLFPRRLLHLLPPRVFQAQSWSRRAYEGIDVLDRSQLLRIFFLSALRYATFSLQYLLLLMAFSGPLAWENALWGITLVFFLKSALPLPGIFELGTREVIAVLVFEGLGLTSEAVVPATFLLYIINLGLPTLVGVVALQRIGRNGGAA